MPTGQIIFRWTAHNKETQITSLHLPSFKHISSQKPVWQSQLGPLSTPVMGTYESGGVVILDGLGVAESLQDWVGLQQLVFQLPLWQQAQESVPHTLLLFPPTSNLHTHTHTGTHCFQSPPTTKISIICAMKAPRQLCATKCQKIITCASVRSNLFKILMGLFQSLFSFMYHYSYAISVYIYFDKVWRITVAGKVWEYNWTSKCENIFCTS